MLECEICGKPVRKGYIIRIDSAELIACEECAKNHEIVEEFDLSKRKEVKTPKIERRATEKELELVEDYGKRIREAREKLKIPLKVLAELINEKESYLKRIENQEVIPSEKTAKAIEKELGITLYEEVEVSGGLATKRQALTLGDMIGQEEMEKKSKK